MPGLFDDDKSLTMPHPSHHVDRPLAERLRPDSWSHFLADDAFDPTLLEQLRSGIGRPPSLVLWGPPGTGKTTFAKLIGTSFKLPFVEFSAVLGGVADIRAIVAAAQKSKRTTLLFVDEIHRFNKAQQDAFLPHVEAGTIVLIGATTENPSFALNSALLSRLRVVVFPSHCEQALDSLLDRIESAIGLVLTNEARSLFIQLAGGDARRMINWCEAFQQARPSKDRSIPADIDVATRYLKNAQVPVYDRAGEQHSDTISAFIKSLRGSHPDAALYYGFHMINAGEDPRYLLRRMMIFASEDIGNADPHALPLAVATADAFDRLGLPEGKIPIAHCITYLACAPKSNRSYLAMHSVIDAIKQHPSVTIPLHLRNAPTDLMKDLGYGKNYQYPHDTAERFVADIRYLPPELGEKAFYQPGNHGYEQEIAARMKVRGQLK